ncbi:MAG: chemotaxis response regulator protein-glutamate methylesterase [Desulfopila sp.]
MLQAHKPLRVLVVDDTIVYRKSVSDIIEGIPGVELAGVAHNGQIALEKIRRLQPDLLTLDIEMPVMNGLEVLAQLRRHYPGIGVVMVSTLTADGSEMTLKALELGAFDFILKPQSRNLAEGKKEIRSLLEPVLQAYIRSSQYRLATCCRTLAARPPTPPGKSCRNPVKPILSQPVLTRPRVKSAIVTIGISTGGPNALGQVLPQLPNDLGVPLLIVQHMPPLFTRSLATSLDKKCALHVKEAEDRETIQPNVVYIAPGGRQMKLHAAADGHQRIIKITDDPPENSCRPSADYLFRSVADYYLGRTTAVIMTGMGTDGTEGLAILKSKGAYVIAQDEPSCVVYGMPKAPTERGYVDMVAPLDRIAEEIVKSVR